MCLITSEYGVFILILNTASVVLNKAVYVASLGGVGGWGGTCVLCL